MTLRKQELDLLVDVYKWLKADGGRPDLAAALLDTINRANHELSESR